MSARRRPTGAWLALGLALGACPEDPTFVASVDSASETAADATGSDADAATETAETGEVTQPPETVDDTSDTADPDTDGDVADAVEVEPGCPDDCGPGAWCSSSVCVCTDDCTATARSVQGAAALAATVYLPAPDAPPAPVVAWIPGLTPGPSIQVARWSGADWKDEGAAGPARIDAPLAVAWSKTHGIVVAHPDETGLLHLYWRVGSGWQDDPTTLTCLDHALRIDPPTGGVVVGCRFPGTGSLGLIDIAPGQVDFSERPWGPLALGTQTRYDWTITSTGRVAVARLRPTDDPEAYEVEVARSAGDDWIKDVLDVVISPSNLVVTTSRGDRVHVLVAQEPTGDDKLIEQYVEADALTWSSSDVRRKSGPLGGFATMLSATPIGPDTIGVAWSEGPVLVWNTVGTSLAGTPATLTAEATRLVALGRGERTPVVVLHDDARVFTWLPRGP